jgi:hypothetical protein
MTDQDLQNMRKTSRFFAALFKEVRLCMMDNGCEHCYELMNKILLSLEKEESDLTNTDRSP